MAARLILEWGYSQSELRAYATRTNGSLRVVSSDTDMAERLRAEQVPVVLGDPTDFEVLSGLAVAPDVILIGGREAARNVTIAETGRRAFPDAKLLVLLGEDAAAETRERLDGIADRLLDPSGLMREELLGIATSATAFRSRRVRSVLEDIDGELAVFMHDNPDPDAIASAVALVRLAEALEVPATAYYYGDITHQSNRAFVNLLDLEIESLDPEGEPPEAGGIALVDHSLPGINDSLPPDTEIDLIFDHHTPSGPLEAAFVDLRESTGATCSIMIEYLRQFGVEIDTTLASALLYGIRTDTKNFERKVTPLDFESAGYVWGKADHTVLERIENPSVSHETISTIADAITGRCVRDKVLSAYVEDIGARDAIAQAADLLLQMEGIDIVLVYGVENGTVYASARTIGAGVTLDLASVMRDAFGQIGTAGGHEDMAGAQISLGVLGAKDFDASDGADPVREVIDERFFEAVESHRRRETHLRRDQLD